MNPTLASLLADCVMIMHWAVGQGLLTSLDGGPDADDTLLALCEAIQYDGPDDGLREAVLAALSHPGGEGR